MENQHICKQVKATVNAILILKQLQEKYVAKGTHLSFAFLAFEKAFGQVPGDVVWQPLKKLGVEEWLANGIQSMYQNTRSRVSHRDFQ